MKLLTSILSTIILTILIPVHCEVFTAISHLEQLLQVQHVVIDNFKYYIEEQKEMIAYFEKRLADYEQIYDTAKEDVSAYFGNPINAFLITKSLTSDWEDLMTIIKQNSSIGLVNVINEAKYKLEFPTEEDLKGAAIALTRLQDTYNMSARNVARGILNGVKYNTNLSASDCFQIGRQAFFSGDLKYAMMWFNEADYKIQNDDQVFLELGRADILRFISFSWYHLKNMTAAIETANIALSIAPNDAELIGVLQIYVQEFQKQHQAQQAIQATTIAPPPLGIKDEELEDGKLKLFSPYRSFPSEKIRYEQLCRKEVQQTPKEQKNLKCRYVTNKSPFLKIAPLKMEEASLDPLIVTYHEVLYDSEIHAIQEFAKPRFERAGIRIYKHANHTVSDSRISKTAWITGEDHPLIRNVELRIEDMTELTLVTSEKMQIVNYGIGGQYEPHFDFALRDDTITFAELGTGNRIATALFYMTNVEQGGATVFPYINVALWPRKGSAAVWYNLYKSGEGDFRTKHGSCPVLVGSKWICNKWLHEYKQELLRPCDLKRDHPPLPFYEDDHLH